MTSRPRPALADTQVNVARLRKLLARPCGPANPATSGHFGRSSYLPGLPATAGVVRRYSADARAASARDEKKPAVV
jgi:hypothetical protein